ncbi:MAG TPA: hypothetical protein DCZ95_01420 [Verrucomicrobia bacterium]|nr:MAG: hypothetical protein A2X46_08860 [Lentisphaerae bacterium GWF2_57_35]HBA82728.1 hypothetical protein [Verrucomicrobiota bacterium]
MSGPMAKRCVFFDRDGIVNVPPSDIDRYVLHVDKFIMIDAFVEALRVVHQKGYEAILVTNQKGVGTGRMTAAALQEIHDKMLADLRGHGLELADIYVCTDATDESPDRKPNPGMLHRAARKHGLDLTASWMVGDSEKDAVAGKRAGCRTVLVSAGHKPTIADHRLTDMKQLPAFLDEHL